MANCVNHPTRRALYECRKCGNPICDECMSLNNRFCTPNCAADFQEFQSKISDTPIVCSTRFSLMGCLRTLVISAVLIIVIWFALLQLFGTTDPAQMAVELKRIWRLAF